MLSVIVLCLVSFVIAQVPRPCTTPSQWEAHVHSSNPKLQADLQAEFSYDSIHQRTRTLQQAKVGETETYYDIITLYQSKLVYYINMKDGSCSHYIFDEVWHDYGIQPDAKSRGEAYIGSPVIANGSLLVTIWSGNRTLPIYQTASYIETWTYEECLPVSNIVFERNNIVNYLWYYNITLGIKDMNIFIPPRQCSTDEKHQPIQFTDFFFVTMNKKLN